MIAIAIVNFIATLCNNYSAKFNNSTDYSKSVAAQQQSFSCLLHASERASVCASKAICFCNISNIC